MHAFSLHSGQNPLKVGMSISFISSSKKLIHLLRKIMNLKFVLNILLSNIDTQNLQTMKHCIK
jgi:hypothetical protein